MRKGELRHPAFEIRQRLQRPLQTIRRRLADGTTASIAPRRHRPQSSSAPRPGRDNVKRHGAPSARNDKPSTTTRLAGCGRSASAEVCRAPSGHGRAKGFDRRVRSAQQVPPPTGRPSMVSPPAYGGPSGAGDSRPVGPSRWIWCWLRKAALSPCRPRRKPRLARLGSDLGHRRRHALSSAFDAKARYCAAVRHRQRPAG